MTIAQIYIFGKYLNGNKNSNKSKSKMPQKLNKIKKIIYINIKIIHMFRPDVPHPTYLGHRIERTDLFWLHSI